MASFPSRTPLDQDMSPEQQEALKASLEQNKNILVTGGGGTGKTFLRKEIKRQLMEQFPGRSEVIVVTHTWLAALQ